MDGKWTSLTAIKKEQQKGLALWLLSYLHLCMSPAHFFGAGSFFFKKLHSHNGALKPRSV